MKSMKKFLALALALVMVLGLAVTANAEPVVNSITITNSASGHKYEVYQIFVGDLAEKPDPEDEEKTQLVLSNIQWGNGVTEAGKTALAGTGTAAELAETIENQADAKAFAQSVKNYLQNPQLLVEQAKGEEDDVYSYTLSGLAAGYYLVRDKAETQLNGAYTEFILKVAGAVEAAAKDSVPSVNKYTKDENDSDANEVNNWQDSADYDIGDHVPFKVEATLASNVESFQEAYTLKFDDDMQAGLTYDGNIEIYMDGVLIYDANLNDAGFVADYDRGENFENDTGIAVSYQGTKLIVTFADATDNGAVNSSVVTMYYTATLNENANHYITGNTNTVKLVYANDPNWTEPDPKPGETPPTPPTGETPPTVVIVYTYKLAVDKVELNPDYDPDKDENNEGLDDTQYIPLEDAGFTLYKKNGTTGEYEVVGEEMKGSQMTQFVWEGLDDGDYELRETTTPAGYNTAAPVSFSIKATHGLSGTNHVLSFEKLEENGLVLKDDVDKTDDLFGALTTQVENKPGVVLPGTGGIGTTIFYAIGGLLVAAAVVLLVTKKRMASAE